MPALPFLPSGHVVRSSDFKPETFALVMVGARTLEQLQDNLGSVGWELSDEHRARLNDVNEMPEPYPYDFINEVSGNR